jgi:hypothetical protein
VEEYNGWSNRFTWNVALWLGSDESLYRDLVEYVTHQRKTGKSVRYDGFLKYAGIPRGTRTPDGVAFHSPNVNRAEMLDFILESV